MTLPGTWMNKDAVLLDERLGSVIVNGQLGSVGPGVVVANVETLHIKLKKTKLS